MNVKLHPSSPEKPILSNIQVIKASLDDIDGIIKVQEQHLISKREMLESEDIEREGFLIHEIDSEELKRLILDKKNCLVLVAKKEDEVIGYIVAYDLKYWEIIKPEWRRNIKIFDDIKRVNIIDEARVLYLRHIARKIGFKGTGSKLMEALINESLLRGYNFIIAEILERPVTNQASISFHKNFGFEKIGEVIENEHLVWNLFCKKVN